MGSLQHQIERELSALAGVAQWIEHRLQIKGLPVQFPVRAHAWVVGQVPSRDLARNPGMCPDWELNWQSFGSQASTQSTEPHQPGIFLKNFFKDICIDFTEGKGGRDRERENRH